MQFSILCITFALHLSYFAYYPTTPQKSIGRGFEDPLFQDRSNLIIIVKTL